MTTYTLSATLDDDEEFVYIEASNDGDATFDAIAIILDRAAEEQPEGGKWSLGLIVLTGPNGAVLHTMEEKGGD